MQWGDGMCAGAGSPMELPHSWMVFLRENPMKIGMITRDTPMTRGNHHECVPKRSCVFPEGHSNMAFHVNGVTTHSTKVVYHKPVIAAEGL